MARILALVAIDEPGVARDHLEAAVIQMKDGSTDWPLSLGSTAHGYPVEVVGVVKDQHEPLVTFFTGEVA